MWFCFGKWARPQFSFGAPTLVRVCVGWFSFAILSVDIDMLIATLVRDVTALKAVEAKRAHTPNSAMVPCQSHKCHMCCPVGDEFCPKEPCLIQRAQHQ